MIDVVESRWMKGDRKEGKDGEVMRRRRRRRRMLGEIGEKELV